MIEWTIEIPISPMEGNLSMEDIAPHRKSTLQQEEPTLRTFLCERLRSGAYIMKS